MERKLASIQKILEIQPISNAETLEVATILGWKVVVKKGQFSVGEVVVYCEIDSLLPEKPEFEFLRAKNFRIRTIKLRGQVSQGIAFPMSILPPPSTNLPEDSYLVGMDVSAALGIVKYEPELHFGLAGEAKGHFPGFLKKTDQTRLQAYPVILDRYKGERFYVTEKLDGSSMTVYFRNGEFGVCSRNLELRETAGNAFWERANGLGLPEKMRRYGHDIALQGELIGPGIQKNRYGLKEKQFRPFAAFDILGYKRIDVFELRNLCTRFDLEMVPVLDFNFVLNYSIDEMVALSSSKSALNPSVDREGIVVASVAEKIDEDIGDLSFKVISPEYLLKNED